MINNKTTLSSQGIICALQAIKVASGVITKIDELMRDSDVYIQENQQIIEDRDAI